MNMTGNEVRESIENKLSRYYGTNEKEATKNQMYHAVAVTVKDILSKERSDFKKKAKAEHARKIYYLCMEFLVGPSLKNNLYNLGLEEQYRSAVSDLGWSLDELYAMDPDPALGNGGLGRLAACFMDSLTTLRYPATGFSILYEYGLFKQKIIDGNQVEMPDVWLPNGEVWLVPRTDKIYNVRLGGRIQEEWKNGRLEITHTDYTEIQAVPYDMLISGSDCDASNNLRLWKAQDSTNFNMKLFTQGQYMKAVQDNTAAETISKVLYPADEHEEGKILRLSQQYFLVSASLQNIIADHLAAYGTVSNIAEKVAIHINDTHPALCIPELMRIFLDVYGFSWESAWDIVTKCVSYTNHTVMPEALECWNEDIFRLRLPRLYMIICEINRRFCADLWNLYPGDWTRISNMSIVANGSIRMANLSIVGSHAVNGVSKLHSDILKKTVFHDFYKVYPDKFTNVTNGIAHRRWLCYSNPRLASLLDRTIGADYRKNPEKIADFAKYADDASVIAELRDIKHRNKETFAEKYKERTGVLLDTHSLFDVQAKRIHEYKRQLLNLLKIVTLYNEIHANPNHSITPQTFIFGGKAALGYYMAKDIIRLICKFGAMLEKDPVVKDVIRIVFLEDYCVSLAEMVTPATDISEQISLAGKEASGTGCMKFMINGALTVGTYDGANIEMAKAVGKDNIYIFGLNSTEVDDLWRQGYSSLNYYKENEQLRNAISTISKGVDGEDFSDIVNYFLTGHNVADPYMCFADYASYIRTCNKVVCDYSNRDEWTRRALYNIAGAGYFAADRSIREYADNIWNIKPVD